MRDEPDLVSKAAIRRSVRARRRAMPQTDRERSTAQLTARLTALVEATGARSVAAYSAVASEPDTGPFLNWALAHDVDVILPVSLAGSQLDWVRFTGAEGLAAGRHGITEPLGPRLGAAAAADVDLMLVPACAVDDAGTRLGWGMGYYDRCLSLMPATVPVYAVVFDEDRYPLLPRDPHDVAVAGAVSPGALTRFLSGTD